MSRDREGSDRQAVWPGVGALCLVQFLDVMGVTVVVTALPDMLHDLDAAPSSGSLVATAYAMFFGGLLMLGARLGDRFGHRRAILGSLVVFALGSLLAAVAPDVWVLSLARCLQGAAAATSVPSALRLLTTVTPDGGARRRALSLWSAAGAAAGVSGFVVGGVVTDLVTWRAVFWAYLPLAVVLALVVAGTVRRDPPVDRRTPLNLPGAALVTTAVMALVVGATLAGEPQHVGVGALLLAASLVVAGLAVVGDRRAAAPMLPPAVLRVRQLRQGTLASALNTLTTGSAITLVTLYLQDALGRSPLEAASMLVPFSVAVIVGSACAGPVMSRLRACDAVAMGLGMIGLSDLLLVPAVASAWALPVCVAVAGSGIGLASVAATSLGTDVPPEARGTASAVVNTAAQLGTAIGVAVLLLVASATSGLPREDGPAPVAAWVAIGVVAVLGSAGFAWWARADTGAALEIEASTGVAGSNP